MFYLTLSYLNCLIPRRMVQFKSSIKYSNKKIYATLLKGLIVKFCKYYYGVRSKKLSFNRLKNPVPQFFCY